MDDSGRAQGSSSSSTAGQGDKPSRVTSGYIEQRIRETLEGLQTEEIRQSYAKAMVMAANLGSLQDASPCHPSQIYRECRLNASMQRDYSIILAKDDAIEFLKDFCATEIREAAFKRAHTQLTYQEKFCREPMKVGKRRMLCTYAEWLCMHDYLFEPKLPQELIDMVPNGWRPPVGFKGETAE